MLGLFVPLGCFVTHPSASYPQNNVCNCWVPSDSIISLSTDRTACALQDLAQLSKVAQTTAEAFGSKVVELQQIIIGLRKKDKAGAKVFHRPL